MGSILSIPRLPTFIDVTGLAEGDQAHFAAARLLRYRLVFPFVFSLYMSSRPKIRVKMGR
jgi:hypothetical protein